MERPKVILHILSGLDGKITEPFMGLPAPRTASGEYGRGAYQADAWLYGTVTTREFTGWREPELEEGPIPALEENIAAETNAPLYYVSIDPLGEVGWESGTFRKAGRPASHVIEVLTEKASAAYRAYLQRRGVSYILAGKDSLDCRAACEKLYRLFGIRTLLICGGSTINWTFVQQGVADELSLLLAPASDGSPDTVTVFEQSPFLMESSPVEFRLKSVEQLEGSAVRLVYQVGGNG